MTASEKLKTAYLILGDDQALVSMEINKIKRKVGKEALEYNYEQIDALESGGATIVAAANTPPFMSDWRFVVTKNVDKLAAAEAGHIVKYLENPSTTTCLVLVGESLAEKGALYKAVAKAGEVIVRRVEKGKVPIMIKTGFQKRGQIASDSVVKLLTQVAGDDMTRLGNEIEKISLYCLDEKVIDLDSARKVVSRSDEARIFELTDRIGARNAQAALKVLEQLMQVGFERKRPSASAYAGKKRGEGFRMVGIEEHAHSILHMLAGHFRSLLRAKSLAEAGCNGHEIIEKLGIKGSDSTKSFLLGKFRQQGENFAIEELKDATAHFFEADVALKSSALSPEIILERLVVALASR